MKHILSFFRALVLSLVILCSAPAKSEAQPYGTNVAQYWQWACATPFNTNIFDVLNDILNELGSMDGLIINLQGLLDFSFDPGRFNGCNLGNINFGGIPQIQLNGFFGCFTSLPNFSGLFQNTFNCLTGALGNFSQLADLLSGIDLTSVVNCSLQTPTIDLSTLSVPDLLSGIVNKIETILELFNSIEASFPDLKKLVGWTLEICDFFRSNGSVGAAMGNTASSSFTTNGTNLNVSVTVGSSVAAGSSASAAAMAVGSGAVAAAKASGVKAYLLVGTNKMKARASDVRAQGKKGRFLKVIELKKSGANYTARVDLKKLPRGIRYSTQILVQSGVNAVTFPGASFSR